MVSFWRIIKFALQDIYRNIGLSLMTIFILVLMLLSINALWSLDVLTKEAVSLAKQQVTLSLYLSAGATDKSINELQNYLRAFTQVTDIKQTSSADVLKNFKERHKLRAEILDALNELGQNPFGPTLTIQAKEPQDYQVIMKAIDVPEYVGIIDGKSFSEHEDALNQLQNITNRVERIGFGLAVLFVLIAFLIMFNTIRVAIQIHHAEISIKRLVGASSWFIRGPYLLQTLIFTIISLGITIILVYLSLRWLDPYLTVVFFNGFSLTNYYNSHKLSLFGAEAVAVLALTLLSASLAMRRQLKV